MLRHAAHESKYMFVREGEAVPETACLLTLKKSNTCATRGARACTACESGEVRGVH